MSTPKDPVIAVLHYFETADLSLAKQALTLAKATVNKRQARSTAAKTAAKPAPAPRRPSTPARKPIKGDVGAAVPTVS